MCHNRGGSYLIVGLNKVCSGYVFIFLQVSGKFELKGHDRMRGFSSLNVHGEDQYMPRQRRDVTYISRLQVGHIDTKVYPNIQYFIMFFSICMCMLDSSKPSTCKLALCVFLSISLP